MRAARRGILLPVILLMTFLGWASLTQAEEIVIGQVASLSGNNGAVLGQGLALGQKIYFEHINAQGGIGGKKIRLITRDDKYLADETVRLTQELLEQEQPLALMGYRGTANTLALVKSGLLEKYKVPLIGTLTGAQDIQNAPYVFHTRTSYREELRKLVRQISHMRVENLAVFYADDAFGKAGLDAVESGIKEFGFTKLIKKFGYDKSPQTVQRHVNEGAKTLLAENPDAILLIAVGDPAYQFIAAARAINPFASIYTMSVINPDAVVEKLGIKTAHGVAFSQVFPFPYSPTLPIVQEYLALLKKYAAEAKPNYFSMEGFVNAKLLVAALKRAPKNAGKPELIKAIEEMGEVDLGGFHLNFSKSHNGSTFSELTVIGKSGKLIR